jgi:uncharacterized OB-fold protein
MSTPLPALDPDNREFWTGGADGRLIIHRCGTCRRWTHPPMPVCRHCRSMDMHAEPSLGTGRVLTYTVNRHQWLLDLPTPYVIAIVELDDEPDLRLMTRLIDVDPDEVRIGARVSVRFEQLEDVWLPLFGPISKTAA